MSLTAGAATVSKITDTTATLAVANATSGTSPYMYQWYRSTSSGFSPGGGNILAGATSQALIDTGLTPKTQYYYVNVVTDSAGSPATANSNQVGVLTSMSQSQNQFAQSPVQGMIDLQTSPNTISAQVDAGQVLALIPGQPVTVVDSAGGVPKVIAATGDTQEIHGFVVYSRKQASFAAKDSVEIVLSHSVQYMTANAAIARFAAVMIVITGTKVATATSSKAIIGRAYDKAVNAGDLIRVYITTPGASVTLAS